MIVAFLQNVWVKDPERVRSLIEKNNEEYRRSLLKRLLFAGGLTGRRLRAAFGELCDEIVWEEASREIAGNSSTICTPDPVHIHQVLQRFQPTIVITFGKVASDAVSPLWAGEIIRLPHPAARQSDVMDKLRQAHQLLICGGQ